MFRFGYWKVTPMSVVARFLLGWTTISLVVSPFVGMLLRRQQLDLAAIPAAAMTPQRIPVRTPVPAR